MARRKAPVSGNHNTLAASAAVYRPGRKSGPGDRNIIAQRWQIEAYRHINICGEARYAATLFSAIAGRAEIGISEPHSLNRKAVWVDETEAPKEVSALAVLAPTVRERSKLIRDFMLHYTIAGECYLIARNRVDTDPDPTNAAPIWEIVAVTELQRLPGADKWQVRHDNNTWLDLAPDDPVIRLWNPDPANRREAWSPFRSLLPTLNEIEWLTKHIFTQVRSRLMSAGVWFLPNNITFAPPPPDAVEGGAEAIAAMNEAEQFMLSLAAGAMQELDADEVSFPSVVLADPDALNAVDQAKLIQFWSDIDDKAMHLRSDAVRRFALGMDLPPEQVLGSSGLAVTGAAGSAGSVNHWGVWANEEQTISAHIEPALDVFTGTLTESFLRFAVDETPYVIAYDTASLRLRQDRSKEAAELYDRGVLKAAVMLRETGFDPENDSMGEDEYRRWLLNRMASGSASPEQVQAAMLVLGVELPVAEISATQVEPTQTEAPGLPSGSVPSLEDHPYEGPPRVQHDQTEAPFSARRNAMVASAEGLVLRALEKQGNRLLNSNKRGRDRDRITPPHLAHLTAAGGDQHEQLTFDFSLLPTVFPGMHARVQRDLTTALNAFCNALYERQEAYSRDALVKVLRPLLEATA